MMNRRTISFSLIKKKLFATIFQIFLTSRVIWKRVLKTLKVKKATKKPSYILLVISISQGWQVSRKLKA